MRRARGFTLVELMIVVAIVAILASLAVSSYNGFMAKSKQVEAKEGLGGIYDLEISYQGENNTYASLSDLAYETDGDGRYSFCLGDPTVPANCVAAVLNPVVGVGGNPHFTPSDFEADAYGAISNAQPPNDVDMWFIDDSRDLVNYNIGY